MKKSAQFAKNVLLAVVIITVAAHAFSKGAWAASGNVQICQKDSTCTVGEFLYDDDYVPIPPANASCEISITDPSGTSLAGSPFATSEATDGWYSYNVVTTGPAGLYRSTICCQAGTDYLCLDKSFEIATTSSTLTKTDVADSVWNAPRGSYTASGSFGEALQNIVPSANAIAAATWGYSSRSLSTFGSLASDVWNNSSTRTLTSFGTFVSDVWNSTTRTLTGASLSSGSLATKGDLDTKVDAKTQELKDEISKVSAGSSQTVTDVQNITTEISNLKKVSQQTNTLLEQIVNKPIIETTTEEVPDLGAKLRDTEGIANRMFINIQYAQSKAGLASLAWNSLEDSEVLDLTQELTRELGGENDSSSTNSVFGHIRFLKESWDWNLVETMKNQVKAVKVVLASIQSEVESSGRSKNSPSKMKTLVGFLNQLGSSIGDMSNKPSQKTLFGKLKETKLLADSLDEKTQDAESLLSSWDKYSIPDKQKRLTDLSKKVVTINRIPDINKTLLSSSSSLEKELKNKSYFVLGIISANKKLLAGKAGSPLTNTWLETGSMVFKSLITNPSILISQNAILNYYLPPEIKEGDIIETDEGLTVKYDTEKNQYYVSGEFYLAPSETKTVSVKTQDIWVINQEEIKSIRKQTEDLSKPLEKTSFFAQGVTLKSDIDVSLDKVLILMKSNTTPEIKIRAYREAEIEMKAVREKIEKLKSLVTQAGSVGTIFGFVGGAQVLAVWGLILIFVVGFVFLALYMRILIKKEETSGKPSPVKEKSPKPHDVKNTPFKLVSKPRNSLRFAMILLGFGIGFGLTFGIILGKGISFASNSTSISSVEKTPEAKVLESEIKVSENTDEKVNTANEQDKIQMIQIIVPPGTWVNVRSAPSLDSAVITKLSQTSQFVQLDKKDGWVKIEIEAEKEGITYNEGWVSAEFTKEE